MYVHSDTHTNDTTKTLTEHTSHNQKHAQGFMIQVRGWGTIGAIMCAAFAVSLFVGGRPQRPR